MPQDNVHSINDEKLAIGNHPQERGPEDISTAFDTVLADFRRDCHPADAAEDALVQLMARNFCNTLRKTRIETGLIESQMEEAVSNQQIQIFAKLNDLKDPDVNYEFDTRLLGIAFDLDCGRNNAQLKITRATALSDAGFHKAQDRLLKLQSQRKPKGAAKLDRAA